MYMIKLYSHISITLFDRDDYVFIIDVVVLLF